MPTCCSIVEVSIASELDHNCHVYMAKKTNPRKTYPWFIIDFTWPTHFASFFTLLHKYTREFTCSNLSSSAIISSTSSLSYIWHCLPLHYTSIFTALSTRHTNSRQDIISMSCIHLWLLFVFSTSILLFPRKSLYCVPHHFFWEYVKLLWSLRFLDEDRSP